MHRNLYSALLYLLTPLVLLKLLWRSLKAPDYRLRWGERFGHFPPPQQRGGIWIHAVSVGEMQAAAPMIRTLLERHPELPMIVTTTTPTGSRRVREMFGTDVFHVYAPYDLPAAVKRFLLTTRPRLAVIMETEIWPNLFHYCERYNIPTIIANARLSERSAKGYSTFEKLTKETLGKVTLLAAQGKRDASRFATLGMPIRSTQVTGSIKFDIKLPASLQEQAEVMRRNLGTDRPVWIAASTHEREDEMVLDAFAKMRKVQPNLLLVLVPRHPERFSRAAELASQTGYRVCLRSEHRACPHETDVFIGDTMGELPLFYAASDVAFVGGSLIPHGGHNPLEAAALGVPVVTGPHVFNFEEISQLLLTRGASRQVKNGDELVAVVLDWLEDANQREAVGAIGKTVIDENRGALQKLIQLIEEQLERRQTQR
ncbi:3-deoxy-D-manno-octulosonic acid transferase [Solemya pervernicosa gill symbiont]|uniref:3-deoxy-D-manno-octulosonic acid transferase n=2 Tax=Gammaproteobacteria incertae sedis TaxID=118884 RepID=A0A1T2L025_9GAMM|nr:lipid IV(A) 3-deoxy-D-manno-octulosonic acid transferase [Candidatus Reidiella endopervernicosa]OOZ38453.1 3-deoxy-D-manno-octulosonic acid transferase [Solemya pervernicosa gill symbiont]QKQ27883.1 lipid IV(A) 3-deoxy-D-manno-octulosonic acid transferase [Candidatus Reidiella endopervernicosa]